MKNERFKTKKIKVSDVVLNKITSSEIMTDKEKIRFMAFVGYLTEAEQGELTRII